MPYTKLKQLRQQHNWTQREIAEKLHVSQNAYSKLETGETRLTIEHIYALAEIYNKQPEYFIASNNQEKNQNNQLQKEASLMEELRTYYYCQKEVVDKLLAAKDEVIQSKEDLIKALKNTIEQLQSQLRG